MVVLWLSKWLESLRRKMRLTIELGIEARRGGLARLVHTPGVGVRQGTELLFAPQ